MLKQTDFGNNPVEPEASNALGVPPSPPIQADAALHPAAPAEQANGSTGFTPGPWTVEEYLDHNDNPCISVMGADGETVYTVTHAVAEDRTNARLMSAAPDLYEALELVLLSVDKFKRNHYGDMDGDFPECMHEWARKAYAALTKARGERA